MRVCSNYTEVAAGQTDALISSGQSITVDMILVTNVSGGAASVTLDEGDGTTLIHTIRMAADGTLPVPFPRGQLFDRGLAVTTPSGVTVLVTHTNGGS